MNLKRRLIIANALSVIIPILITALVALAFVFVMGKVNNTDAVFENAQKLTMVQVELMGSENSILRNNPELLNNEVFQNQLQDRLEEINGELVILKGDQAVFSSVELNKIDVERLINADGLTGNQNTVHIGNLTYLVQSIYLTQNEKIDNASYTVFLLAPGKPFNLNGFMIFIGILFILSFIATNFAVTYHFSRNILKPINNLQKAAAEISLGNLDCEIVEEGDYEISQLCRDLEHMRIKLKNSIHAQLKEEDARKLLVSSISHDLKTPVTSIKGYVEGILDGVANTEEKREKYLKTIYRKAERIDTMIDDLLLYAKLDLNQIPFNFEMTNIKKFLEDGLSEIEPELQRSNIRLSFISELEVPAIIPMDRERFQRVIINIIDNSRKYMDKDQGLITIALRETRTSLIMDIRDNGSGIPERDLPYIFDRFYRSDMARSEIKGSGLGLAISRQIVEGHDGRIWAVSHGNEGTSVIISLRKE